MADLRVGAGNVQEESVILHLRKEQEMAQRTLERYHQHMGARLEVHQQGQTRDS